MIIQSKLHKGTYVLALALLISSCASTGDNGVYTELSSSRIGSFEGFTYEFWNQNGTGDAAMTLRKDGSFDVGWSGIYNMLARNGVRPGQNVKSVTYAVDDYAASKGNSYLCVYGWTYDSGTWDNLVEFYIVDNWKNYRPPGSGGLYQGTISVDGGTYDIYTSIRVNQPSINGNRTFFQYWSVRQNGGQRTSGTIDVEAHFNAWKEQGMEFGNTMYEVSFCIEGYGGKSGGDGQASVRELSFNVE